MADWAAMQSAGAAVSNHTYSNAGVDVSDYSTSVDAGAVQQFQAEDQRLRGALASARDACSQDLNAAQGIKTAVQEAARRASNAIRAAGDMSPTADQNWFERQLEAGGHWVDEHGAGVRDWIGEHADVIRTVGEWTSTLGKGIMAFGTGVAVLGAVLAPETLGLGLLLELPAGVIMAGGGLLWSAGDAAQVTSDWGQGKIDGKELIVKTAIAGATALGVSVALKVATKVGQKFLPGILAKIKGKSSPQDGTIRKSDPGQHSEYAGEGQHIERVAPPSQNYNKVTFHADPETGRTFMVTGVLRRHFPGLKRSDQEVKDQARARLRRGDDGGHIIAHRFLQDAGMKNLFSHDRHLNMSAYRTMENEWGDWIDHGMEVHPTIRLNPPGAQRPTNIVVVYEVREPSSGTLVHSDDVTFRNKSGETFDRVSPSRMQAMIERAAKA